MSLLLRADRDGSAAGPTLLPLMAATAVCDVAGAQARIKWPNDVVVEGSDGRLAKLAGILVEGRPQAGWAVLGIGLNVAVALHELPAELRPDRAEMASATGLPAATMGLEPDQVEPTLARLLGALERRLAEAAQATLEAWRARDALQGREVSWANGRGRAAGIDGNGRLVVALAGGGQTTVGAGEVHLREIS